MFNVSILNIINIFSNGIVFTSAILIFMFGYKTVSTRFHALFWFYNSLFLACLNINDTGIFTNIIFYKYLSIFIPFFYLLALITEKKEQFKIYYLLIFVIPLILFFFADFNLFQLFYHLIIWILLIPYTILQIGKKRRKSDDTKGKLYFIVPLIIFIAVFPFIIINLIIIKKTHLFHLINILPPSLALASLIELYFSYHKNLLILNHSYYQNLDFIKKSSAIEKQNLTEKIAASIVHEIKNPISAIQSLTEQLQTRYKTMENNKIDEYLEVIQEELHNLKNFSESYLKIWKKKEGRKDIISIKKEFENIVKLLKYDLMKKNINVTTNIKEDINILFTVYHFQQIIINLIYNAIEAGSSIIKINVERNDQFINIFLINNGKTIDDEIKNKIFTPFFSTKLDGTGMGLSICKEILHQNMGKILLEKSNAEETIFKISLDLKISNLQQKTL